MQKAQDSPQRNLSFLWIVSLSIVYVHELVRDSQKTTFVYVHVYMCVCKERNRRKEREIKERIKEIEGEMDL